MLECVLECNKSVYKWLCSGRRGNCTAPLERCMVATFRGVCGCAVAHALLKGTSLRDSIGCVAVQLHIPAHMHMHR